MTAPSTRKKRDGGLRSPACTPQAKTGIAIPQQAVTSDSPIYRKASGSTFRHRLFILWAFATLYRSGHVDAGRKLTNKWSEPLKLDQGKEVRLIRLLGLQKGKRGLKAPLIAAAEMSTIT